MGKAKNDNLKGQGFHTNPERRNKKGKPKGALNMTTLLRHALKSGIDVINGQGKKIRITGATIVQTHIKKAASGDMNAIKLLYDRNDGLLNQPITVDETTPDLSQLTSQELKDAVQKLTAKPTKKEIKKPSKKS